MSAVLKEEHGEALLPLKGFQQEARNAALKVLKDTAGFMEADPARRRDIARRVGVTLLRSPTGSGKTLTVGRTLEAAVGKLPRKTVWLWLTPFSGLVTQTREALAAQCPGLRLRDVASDRNVSLARDGDVFVTTWASVATDNANTRVVRRDDESMPGIDLFLAALRAGNFRLGVVIDEAHLNFGMNAKQAAGFYLNVVDPDFTFLVTATPKDDDLDRFARSVGIGDINRIEVSRESVVRACLNKVGIKAVHFRADERDERVLDMAEVAVFAGLARHELIRKSLRERGIELSPLLLIQVENSAEDGPDPVERIRGILANLKVEKSRIAIHTSKEPDPFFHTLAYDERKDILVFKMSAATGFDAPRAWTLVSLRASVGPEFGLQVIGRIMRVHPRTQHLHAFASDPPREDLGLLDFGYVFLAHPGQQFGLIEAARELKAFQSAVETLTDNVQVLDVGEATAVLLDPANGFMELLQPPPVPDPSPRGGGNEEKSGNHGGTADTDPAGVLDTVPNGVTPDVLSTPLNREVARRALSLFNDETDLVKVEPRRLDLNSPVEDEGALPAGRFAYKLRTDIEFPRTLAREVMPRAMDGLVQCIADRIRIDDEVLAFVHKTRGQVHITEEELFGGGRHTTTGHAPVSAARIAAGAQDAFRFNDSIDERDLKPVLLERLRRSIEAKGWDEPTVDELRRAVDLLGLMRPNLVTDACRSCLAGAVDVLQNEPIPPFYEGPPNLDPAQRSLYGVFPHDLNKEELAFARLLDADTSGTVLWWSRNPSNARWAVSIVLPNGERHFPDFVIGVNSNRKSLNSIALAEVKDDGTTGRLFSEKNGRKVRTHHGKYGRCLMVYREGTSDWYQVVWRADIQKHIPGDRFDIGQLIWTD